MAKLTEKTVVTTNYTVELTEDEAVALARLLYAGTEWSTVVELGLKNLYDLLVGEVRPNHINANFTDFAVLNRED